MKRPEIEVSVLHEPAPIPVEAIEAAARAVLEDCGRTGLLSVAVVDDETIHRLNRDHLGHDEPTDCLSFDLAGDPNPAAPIGEVVVSADTARRVAAERGEPFAVELLLYVVHATLHLCGHDDHDDGDRARMEAAQAAYVERFAGLATTPPRPVD